MISERNSYDCVLLRQLLNTLPMATVVFCERNKSIKFDLKFQESQDYCAFSLT